MRRSLDEMLGGKSKIKKEEVDRDDLLDEIIDDEKIDIQSFHRPVSVNFLSHVFRKDKSTVKKLLADLPPVRYAGNKRPEYDFLQASSYLVRPRMNVHEAIKSLRPEELPVDLQKEYWQALSLKQKYEITTGKLWRTEDVIAVFGEVFQHIRSSTQLWISAIERQSRLPPEQFEVLNKLVDALMTDIHDRVDGMKKKGKTVSALDYDEFEDEDV